MFDDVELPEVRRNADVRENPQPHQADHPDYVPILRSIQITAGAVKPGTRSRTVEGPQTAWQIKPRTAAPDSTSPSGLNLPMSSRRSCRVRRSTIFCFAGAHDQHRTGDRADRRLPSESRRFRQLPLRIAGSKETTKFASISGSPIVAEVELAGSAYVLFVQPCCMNMIAEDDKTAAGDKAAGASKSAASDKAGSESGWVLNALVPKGEIQRAGQAFPTAVVLALSIALLLAVFGWPFLKLVLIGEHERVRIYDVLLVAVCSLLGLSLLTLGTLDSMYQKLTAALDDQLTALANDIVEQTEMEVHSAYRQLVELEKHAREHPDLGTRVTGLAGDPDATTLVNDYPYFSSFALISDGEQYAKWTLASFVTPRSVADRDYLTHWDVERPAGNFYRLHSLENHRPG